MKYVVLSGDTVDVARRTAPALAKDDDGNDIAGQYADGHAWVSAPDTVFQGWTLAGATWSAPVLSLTEKRAIAELDRKAFCAALFSASLMTKDSAALAGRGGWPTEFANFLSGLSDASALAYELEWSTVQIIHYAHPLLQAIALNHTSQDQAAATALLDTIFGIS